MPWGDDIEREYRLLHAPPSYETIHPADEIVKLAKEEDAEAIVMGTHGRSGLNRLIAGSVGERVMRQAPCPVITVSKPRG